MSTPAPNHGRPWTPCCGLLPEVNVPAEWLTWVLGRRHDAHMGSCLVARRARLAKSGGGS